MPTRMLAMLAATLVCSATLQAQVIPAPVTPAPAIGWRGTRTRVTTARQPAVLPQSRLPTSPIPGTIVPGSPADTRGSIAPAAAQETAPADITPINRAVRTQRGAAALPNDAGQVWVEYDISPYTRRVTTTNHPEQAIIDWILRETGYEAWHSDPLGVLSASPRSLRVYHTPAMQQVCADIADRFVSSEAEAYGYSLRVVSLGNPNWRLRAAPMFRAVESQTQGVQAWVAQKEDAATLLAELGKRTDFNEHSGPYLLVQNGQPAVVSVTRPKPYIKDIRLAPGTYPGYESLMGQIDEGMSLEINPLLSLDQQTIDAVVKCHVDQVEKLIPLTMEISTPVAPRQKARLEVPQMSQCRLHERFRWPVDRVLVVALGMVCTPSPIAEAPIIGPILQPGPDRADLVLFIECKGPQRLPPGAAVRSVRFR